MFLWLFTLLVSVYGCDLAKWREVIETDFSDGKVEGWTEKLDSKDGVPPIHQCQEHYLLGGDGRLGKGSELRWTTTTPRYSIAKIYFRLWFLNTWDGEEVWVKVNEAFEPNWKAKHYWNAKGKRVCNFGFETSNTQNNDEYIDVEVTVQVPSEATSISITFGTTLDQQGSDESFAISFFKVVIIEGKFLQIASSDFTSPSHTQGWREHLADGSEKSPVPVDKCGDIYMLGGQARLGAGATLEYIRTNTEYYSAIRIKATFWFLDSWDNELATLRINNDPDPIWQVSYHYSTSSAPSCTTPAFGTHNQLNYDGYVTLDVVHVLDAPTNEIVLLFGTTLNQDGQDESFALSSFEVLILPECPPPVVKDSSVDLKEGDLITLQLTSNDDEDVMMRIYTLPSKGQLYQWEQSDPDHLLPINKPYTLLATSAQHNLKYRAYVTFEGNHTDFFTYRAEYEGGTGSNEGKVSMRIFEEGKLASNSSSTTNTNTNSSLRYLLVVAFVFLFLLLAVLAFFGYYIYKKDDARKEIIQMFLGQNDEDGAQVYFPEEPSASSDGSSLSNSL